MSTPLTEELFTNFMALKRLSCSYYHERLKDSDIGLTGAQIEVLLAVEHLEPITFKDLALHLMLQPAAVTQTIESLVQNGCVSRTISDEDRRMWLIKLTPVGQNKLSELRPYLHERQKLLAEALDESEIAAFVRMQAKLIQHLHQNIHCLQQEGALHEKNT